MTLLNYKIVYHTNNDILNFTSIFRPLYALFFRLTRILFLVTSLSSQLPKVSLWVLLSNYPKKKVSKVLILYSVFILLYLFNRNDLRNKTYTSSSLYIVIWKKYSLHCISAFQRFKVVNSGSDFVQYIFFSTNILLKCTKKGDS